MKYLLAAFLAIVVIGAFVLFKGVSPESSLTQIPERNVPAFAIEYTPPSGWTLWEGISAQMSSFVNRQVAIGYKDPDKPDVSELQTFIEDWSPAESDVWVFTRSDVDTKTRELSKIYVYAGEVAEDPLKYDTINLILSYGEVSFSEPALENERMKRQYLNLADREVKYDRVFAFAGYDQVFLKLQLTDRVELLLVRSVTKEVSDEEVLADFASFLERFPNN